MRSTFHALLFAGLTLAAHAQITVAVTPQCLTGWTVVGTDTRTLSAQSSLSLPAGAQLARPFAAGDVTVTITTSPAIGSDSTDFPVLEIGPAAIVFTRDGATGHLLLVNGDDPVVVLPVSFALDDTGRSTAPVTLAFRLQAEEIDIQAGGQTLTFPTTATSDPRVSVVASAGGSHAWDLASFSVTAATALSDQIPEMQAPSPATPAPAATTPTAAHATTGGVNTGTTPLVVTSVPAGAASAAPASATPNPQPALEVFTPPAIRHGRPDVIRAALASTKN